MGAEQAVSIEKPAVCGSWGGKFCLLLLLFLNDYNNIPERLSDLAVLSSIKKAKWAGKALSEIKLSC